MIKNPVILCILDGFGHSKTQENNAIALANTKTYDSIKKHSVHTLIEASGLAVGLPDGQMGNSEVGHITMGLGRVLMQNLPKINQATREHGLEKLEIIQKILKEKQGNYHIMGLVSDGGVHAHIDHIIALANIVATKHNVFLHLFTDGRDTSPKSALEFVNKITQNVKNATIATVSGRFYAMDRDNNMERTALAYNAIANAKGQKFENPIEYIESRYKEEELDEFITPAVNSKYKGMQNEDSFIMANFRSDRARQICNALAGVIEESFINTNIKLKHKIGMVSYSKELDEKMEVIFSSKKPNNSLGEIVAKHDLAQLRIAETEKYAHVTFFFNGGSEKILKGEERILVPSPKVATYDEKPEMSAPLVTEKLTSAILQNKYDLIVLNFANPDMVGHTGNLQATIKAIEVIDECLLKIKNTIDNTPYSLIITADHGNCEEMWNEKLKSKQTAHTTNKVDFIFYSNQQKYSLAKKEGELQDIAPTILTVMGLEIPQEMSGKSLLYEEK